MYLVNVLIKNIVFGFKNIIMIIVVIIILQIIFYHFDNLVITDEGRRFLAECKEKKIVYIESSCCFEKSRQELI